MNFKFMDALEIDGSGNGRGCKIELCVQYKQFRKYNICVMEKIIFSIC